MIDPDENKQSEELDKFDWNDENINLRRRRRERTSEKEHQNKKTEKSEFDIFKEKFKSQYNEDVAFTNTHYDSYKNIMISNIECVDTDIRSLMEQFKHDERVQFKLNDGKLTVEFKNVLVEKQLRLNYIQISIILVWIFITCLFFYFILKNLGNYTERLSFL